MPPVYCTSTVPLTSQNREISYQSSTGRVIQLERATLGYPTPLSFCWQKPTLRLKAYPKHDLLVIYFR